MLVRTSAPTRRVAAVGVATLALCLTGSPAYALALETLTDPVSTTVEGGTVPVAQVLEPVTTVVSPSPSPSSTPTTAPAPAPAPVTGQGTGLQPVAAPATGSTTTTTGTAPGVAGTGDGARRTSGGSGTAGSPTFDGFSSLPGLFGGTGRTGGLAFGGPMIAGAADNVLGLPAPLTAPFVEVQASSARSGSTPGGLPALVVVVAAVAVGAAGAGQAAELRRRRAAAVSR